MFRKIMTFSALVLLSYSAASSQEVIVYDQSEHSTQHDRFWLNVAVQAYSFGPPAIIFSYHELVRKDPSTDQEHIYAAPYGRAVMESEDLYHETHQYSIRVFPDLVPIPVG